MQFKRKDRVIYLKGNWSWLVGKCGMITEIDLRNGYAMVEFDDGPQGKFLMSSLGYEKNESKPDWRTKFPVQLIPASSLEWESQGFGFGAYEKYAPHDWRNQPITTTEHARAAIHHIYEWLDGVEKDHESGANPLCHAKARLAMVIDTLVNRPQLDDRYKERNNNEQ